MSKARMSDDFLTDGKRAGLYHLPAEHRQAVEQQAHRHGFAVHAADLSACRTTAEALAALGRACAFPEWYGGNFDALLDCLADPEGLSAPGQLLLISGIAPLRLKVADDLSLILDVLAAASEERRTNGPPLWILLDAPASGVAPWPGR